MSIDMKSAVDIGAVLKALADPIRWQIVELLAREELCVCHLVEELGAGQPLVSHHLKVLRGAGLVDREHRGYWTWYRLLPEGFGEVHRATGRLAESAAASAGRRRRPCAVTSERKATE